MTSHIQWYRSVAKIEISQERFFAETSDQDNSTQCPKLFFRGVPLSQRISLWADMWFVQSIA